MQIRTDVSNMINQHKLAGKAWSSKKKNQVIGASGPFDLSQRVKR